MRLSKKEDAIVLKKEVKAILFDMDGVLTDSYHAWSCIINDALKSIGRNALSKKTLRKQFGAPVERDQKTHFKGYSVEQIRKLYLDHYHKHKNKIVLFPHTRKILQEIKDKNIKIGLISNSTKDIIHPVLKRFGIDCYFDVVMSMDDVTYRKPHPEMVLRACKILGVKPQETVVVGDTQNDMIAGKKAGCTTVGIKTKGDCTVHRLTAIRRFLKLPSR